MFTKLTEKQIKEKLEFSKNFSNSKNPADGSIVDANANLTIKSIPAMEHEMFKDFSIQINRKRIFNKLEELFDKPTAESYMSAIKNHYIYIHDEISSKPYCCSITLTPYLLNGTKNIGGESTAPKHLHSFAGSFVNLIYILASHVNGAVGVSEFFLVFDYFANKDFGNNYLIEKEELIKNYFQEIIYCLNQPASARGGQSVFSNFSIFDKYFFDRIFNEFVYPDLSKPDYNRIRKLQFLFLNWFNKERTKAILTFPVVTVSMLIENDKPKDTEFAKTIAQELSEGNSFFIYQSKTADSLSSCCFDENEMCLSRSSNVINYMTFKELYKSKYDDTKQNFKIFHNGSWVDGKLIKIDKNQKRMFKVITINNKEIIVTENHIHPTFLGDKSTIDLTPNDYILFNNSKLDPISEQNLTLSQGIFIGVYLRVGSLIRNVETGFNFFLNEKKYKKLLPHIISALKAWGISESVIKLNSSNNIYSIGLYSENMMDKIRYWVKGNYANEKEINMDCLAQSIAFRSGIIKGIYIINGRNNQIYSTSEKMIKQLETIIVSLGFNSIIDINNKIIIRKKEYNRNFKLYCIRIYSIKNKRDVKDVYKIKNNLIYFKIKNIYEINNHVSNDVYCFEMVNQEEPYFTLPNGIITHNCRLRSELVKNTFSYTLGAIGVMTGSVRVITLNLNRIIQEKYKINKINFISFFKNELKNIVQTLHKYHIAHREVLKEFQKNGMMPIFDAGFISLDKEYSTIGINGIVEAAEFLGYDISNNEKYTNFITEILKVINEENKIGKMKYHCMFNTEFVPAENLGVKNAKWDKEAGFEVKRDCYNSYLYKVEDETINVIDKFILHGEKSNKYLDGGSALHLNLEEEISKEQYLKLFEIASKTGCSYWTKNVKSSYCEDCNNIDKRTLYECPKCKSKNISWLTRIIGYLKKIKNFSSARQVEAALRFYHKENIK